jgi:hypothetical protein
MLLLLIIFGYCTYRNYRMKKNKQQKISKEIC